jgi:predicted 3-demethylubiquinone-9 3-methyltransferase (glyoxalase superfamily)
VLENGHYFVIFNDEHQIDMSQIIEGGSPDAWVLENSFAEMDADDNPIFIWRGLDHFDVADAVHEDLTQEFIDFCHMNSIENNQFDWVNDSYQISYQHDFRVLPNGNYTVFDNGNHREPQFSRALELALDTQNMTATKVFKYRETPDIFSRWMGSTQRVSNGNTIVNWAIPFFPKLTEVRPDGTKAYEMNFIRYLYAYRTHRSPWIGGLAKRLFLT